MKKIVLMILVLLFSVNFFSTTVVEKNFGRSGGSIGSVMCAPFPKEQCGVSDPDAIPENNPENFMDPEDCEWNTERGLCELSGAYRQKEIQQYKQYEKERQQSEFFTLLKYAAALLVSLSIGYVIGSLLEKKKIENPLQKNAFAKKFGWLIISIVLSLLMAVVYPYTNLLLMLIVFSVSSPILFALFHSGIKKATALIVTFFLLSLLDPLLRTDKPYNISFYIYYKILLENLLQGIFLRAGAISIVLSLYYFVTGILKRQLKKVVFFALIILYIFFIYIFYFGSY